jgi:hypothetical protein
MLAERIPDHLPACPGRALVERASYRDIAVTHEGVNIYPAHRASQDRRCGNGFPDRATQSILGYLDFLPVDYIRVHAPGAVS